MRARIGAIALALGSSLPVGLTLAAGPAAALSCAPHPGASPQAIASGTEQLAGGGRFFDSYDFAVIGTVTAVRTDERQGSPTYGATEIDLDVAGVLGVEEAPAAITLRAGDPGWMVGYGFVAGASYFVPVDAVGPEGEVNWTFACDPVTELADPSAAVAELSPLASEAGIPLTAAAEGPAGDPPSGPAERGDDGLRWFAPATTVAAVGAATITTVVLLRRQPRRAPAR